MTTGLLQDWGANRGNPRSQLVLVLFRLAQATRQLPLPLRWLGWPVIAIYSALVVWILGIELNHKATVGPGLRIYHGVGLVVHEKATLGAFCTLRHCTTIGVREGPDDVPTLGDHVDVGSNCVLIGRIQIGNRAKIGAGSVLLHSVPAGKTFAGNPAKLVSD